MNTVTTDSSLEIIKEVVITPTITYVVLQPFPGQHSYTFYLFLIG